MVMERWHLNCFCILTLKIKRHKAWGMAMKKPPDVSIFQKIESYPGPFALLHYEYYGAYMSMMLHARYARVILRS